MFQGIVEQKAQVLGQKDSELILKPQKPWKAKIGSSVAVNGACLTIKKSEGGKRLFFDLGQETRQATMLGRLKPGCWVNVERPLRFGDPIDGHIVLGHVDQVGTITDFRKKNNSVMLEITTPDPRKKAVALTKGSVALDGVSLTLNKTYEKNSKLSFGVCLVPETLKRTTLGDKKPGDMVNIEFDYMAKVWMKRPGARYNRSTND